MFNEMMRWLGRSSGGTRAVSRVRASALILVMGLLTLLLLLVLLHVFGPEAK